MKRIIMVVAMLTLLTVGLTACGDSTETALAEDANLQITGGGIDINYTPEELGELPTETVTTENVSSSGEVTEVELVGISLAALLAEQGIELKDVSSIELAASDGYVMAVAQEEYVDSDIYIVLEENGEALDYPRSAIPEKRAMFWVKYLNKITIETSGTASAAEMGPVDTISMFRENIGELESEKVNDEEDEYNAYSNEDYYEYAFGKLPTGKVAMEAEDGLEKVESADLFFDSYVTIDKDAEDTPLYYGEDIKVGMKVKTLKYSAAGGKGVYYGKEISLKDLFADLQMEEASFYKFTAADGFSVEIPADAIDSGKISTVDGALTTDFGSYDLSSVKGKGKISNLATIEAVK